MGARSSSAWSGNGAQTKVNVDGSIRDEDVFIIDDENDEESDAEDSQGSAHEQTKEPVFSTPDSEIFPSSTPDCSGQPWIRSSSHSAKSEEASTPDAGTASQEDIQNAPGQPPKYFIKPDDTLLGISLRLGIDVRRHSSSRSRLSVLNALSSTCCTESCFMSSEQPLALDPPHDPTPLTHPLLPGPSSLPARPTGPVVCGGASAKQGAQCPSCHRACRDTVSGRDEGDGPRYRKGVRRACAPP